MAYRPVSDVCINRKSSDISTDLLSVSQSISSNTKHQAISFYFYMATWLIAFSLYCFRLLQKITLLSFVYRITVPIPYSLSIVLLGPLKSYLKKEAAACNITRYSKASRMAFAWSKVASVGVDKKNELDVTFCILYFSSNSCATCFGQWTHYLPTGLDHLPAATAHTNTRL